MIKKNKMKREGMAIIITCMVMVVWYHAILSVVADAPRRSLAVDRAASGFISIDCGMTEDSRYDGDEDLYYTSDAEFIDTGRSVELPLEYRTDMLPLYNTLRSFPNGDRNCYTLKPLHGRNYNYLIRARFSYGNYDGLNKVPIFDLYIGVNYWTSVQLTEIDTRHIEELIYTSPTDYIYVCLVNVGQGTPIISALELRPLNDSAYTSNSGALVFYERLDAGLTGNYYYISYRDDAYDRTWAPIPNTWVAWNNLSTNATINSESDAYKLPPSVMGTAAKPVSGSNSLVYQTNYTDSSQKVYVYWHFAEIENLGFNDSREFVISMTGDFKSGPISPKYLEPLTIASGGILVNEQSLGFSIQKTTTSTLPPILNAMEIYPLLQSATNQEDVYAMMNIKSNYAVRKTWQGDPCLPVSPWDGLNCSNSGDDSPRITSLNLAQSGLTGDIPPTLSALTSLVYLNLSYNDLTGVIPDFLAELPSLRTIDLRSNKLTGSVPLALNKKVEDGSLYLSVEENPDLCISHPCKKKNLMKLLVPLVAIALSIVGFFTAISIYCICKQKRAARALKNASTLSKKWAFSYFEVANMTSNFQRIIGRGGSGTVYHGFLQDGIHVAVKILNPSILSFKMFHTEVQLLLRVHHKNLVSLIGYCEEGNFMALIYENMASGNLQQHLLDNNVNVLCWKDRLQISVEAAQGLEYLHSGCRPPIIHRDMKTSNILLDDKLHAKIGDFGISRIFLTENERLSTGVVGTYGYVDPEYYASQRPNEKSDVYSFGVVLLELITGRPAVMRGTECIHIIKWMNQILERGDILSIVDKRLQ